MTKRSREEEGEMVMEEELDELLEETKDAQFSEVKGKKKSAGTFLGMGLNAALIKAIHRKGFRLPTPIQRKCIPPLLEGRDVVGMARTGSGKTAAFVLPMLQRLREHSAKVGIRGLIMSPSRELALQTFSVVRELGKLTNLRTVVLVGGDGLEDQFVQLATNPDIVIATPGRLMHLCVEAKMSLREVQMVVWDEADRLMEDATMAEQMVEVNARFPSTRQTALFSATLPKALAQFAQTGLRDPLLVRLDTESKLSPDLRMCFVQLQSGAEREAMLLLLLQQIMARGTPLTVIFTATKHHVEYLQELLRAFDFPSTHIHGSLDQAARRLALEQFKTGRSPILVVTDVAARGLDIPLLDNVINYDFPATPKLFVHRVGRVARAGRPGTAYSLLSGEELPYLFDLQLFLAMPLSTPTDGHEKDSLMIGSAPRMLVGDEMERISLKHSFSPSLFALKEVMDNATRLYRRTRPVASPESHRRCKQFLQEHSTLAPHPSFCPKTTSSDDDPSALLNAIHKYKPRSCHLALFPPHKQSSSSPSPSITPNMTSRRDKEYYLAHAKRDTLKEEQAYSITNSFAQQARKAVLDLGVTVNEDPMTKRKRSGTNAQSQPGKEREHSKLLKTEIGTAVRASYHSGAYEKWRTKTHLDILQPGEVESEQASSRARAMIASKAESRRWRGRSAHSSRSKGTHTAPSRSNKNTNGKGKSFRSTPKSNK